MTYLEIAAIVYVIEIKPHLIAIETKVDIGSFRGFEQVLHIKGVTQEKPFPSEIWTKFEDNIRGERQSVSVVSSHFRILIHLSVLRHYGKVILLRFNVIRIFFTK